MQHFWGLVQDPPHKTLQTPHHRVAKNPAVSFYRSFSPPKRETISKRQPGNIPGRIEVPITDPALIAAYFPEIRPTWDYNMVEGRERLLIYHQALLADLKAVAGRPTNMAKVYDVRQGGSESLAAYLERLMEAFSQYTLYDLETQESAQMIRFAYINQAAPDIKQTLQALDRLGEKSIRDLVAVVEKVYNKKETEEQRQERKDRECEIEHEKRDRAKEKRPDLLDSPLSHAEYTWFTNGSSFI
ncbi:uncharacterized protein [Dipodomys merriami]|uniref:uncharacterized protein isoform X1 n=1 Tax=Dipodomys merriami TaxID=94247 RepID=UPI0038509479